MASLIKYMTGIVLFLVMNVMTANSTDPNKEIAVLLEDLSVELQIVQMFYRTENNSLYQRLNKLSQDLKAGNSLKEKVALLIEKDHVLNELKLNELSEATDISKIRYLKGLQIIKILYEKTLTLDHHYASVATFNEINNLGNPNNYPEFIEMKAKMTKNQDKKSGFELSSILGDNIYTSVVHSMVSLFNNSSANKKEKEEHLKEIECILDFTLRMHNDLNIIYFETAFLQKSNTNVMLELQQLFVDYTKPIKYHTALEQCRNTDDWERIRDNLGTYLKELDKALKDDSQRYKAHKMQINLEFPIDRLLQFIILYNGHIDQGAKFYEKFGVMLNSYENEKQCATKIPLEYKKLKDNIAVSIEKFNTAYKPIEINGSKMKQILYGINEFE
ncbi:hypothetical protein [Nonlabens sp.]|uniref:hypothetical protein n=1 Tax=Nonlabens sp. TaxID=1888209 RepID=UPI001BCBCFCF|nr:hypothetical protein [Nonlabens sp.]